MLRTFSGRAPSQNELELRGFIDLLQREGVHRYCEIGARHGDTFHEIMLSLPSGSVGLAVDLPGAVWGTEKSRHSLIEVVADLTSRGYLVSYLLGDSQNPATAEMVYAREPFDAVLIDADHSLAGVTRDWENYRACAPLIAFHDIVGTGQSDRRSGTPVEVPLLWERLKAEHKHLEFVDDGSLMGIGVLWT